MDPGGRLHGLRPAIRITRSMRPPDDVTFGDGVTGAFRPPISPIPRRASWRANTRGAAGDGQSGAPGSFRICRRSSKAWRALRICARLSAARTRKRSRRRSVGPGDAVKNKGRAVTPEDFEALAKETPLTRILRAKALALMHPQFPGAKIPGAVTVIVVPEGDGPRPTPNESTLRAVCLWLNKARLLTTEVWVMPPVYRTLLVEADVIVKGDEDLATVKREIEERIKTFLNPLTGGENGGGWDFGGPVYYSKVYRVLIETPGVDRIENNQMVLWLDGVRGDFCRDLPIGTGELITSETHEIRVKYATEQTNA